MPAQVLVNQVWTSSSGQPDETNFPISEWDDINWNSSITTASNDIITVGNTLQSSGNTDVLVTKRNSLGQILWEKTYAGPAGGYDYGLAVTLDNNGNILAAGTVTNSNQTTDIVLLKYSATGTLVWSSLIDGGSNLHDIATALVADANNNVYLVGVTVNLTTKSDCYLTKISSSGVQLWSATYDYANLHEIPISVELESGNFKVIGFSNSAVDAWDLTSLTFSGLNGSLLSESRTLIPNLSISESISVVSDDSNNIYIAGSTNPSSSGNQDIQLIKINDNFDIDWIQEVDAEGLKDESKSIIIDSDNNIIVAGNSEKSNGGTQITLSKFSAEGELILNKSYMAPITYQTAEVTKIKTNNENDIFVAGTVYQNGSKDFVLLMYDSEGSLRIEKFFDGEGNTQDVATNLEVLNQDEVLITGRSQGTITQYTTVKYEIRKRPDTVIYVNGQARHKAKELIIKFNPAYVDTSFVDDKTQRFGTIHDILSTQAASKIANDVSLDSIYFTKVFPNLLTSHTKSISRLGDTIPMPAFWSQFVLITSDGQELDSLINQFESFTDFVKYAHRNHVYQPDVLPDDDFFVNGDQSSLLSTVFPNADINVEPAWDIETGQNYTKVGVYDNVIFWAHEDFGATGNLEDSQIVGGWDFNNNVNISGVTDPGSHGTACAGIIGALRDNNDGIAGIAGGGADAEGNINEGVQLFSLGIFDENSFAGYDVVSAAIIEGAMFDPSQSPPGYGLHIQNHSWGGPEDNQSLEEAVEFAWRNQCILVASRGNEGNTSLRFPATYTDGWILSVGGSDTNGEHYDGDEGNEWATSEGANVTGSSYGENMDIIAPAVTELVMSLINPDAPFRFNFSGTNIYPPPVGNDNNYQVFRGTSAAVPHVSGVAALMYSRHHTNQGQPNNLAPEDVEFILQEYSTDIATGPPTNYPVGYDDENGWGRLNAFEAVSRIEGPAWQVFHNDEPRVSETLMEEVPFGIGGLVWRKYRVIHSYHDVFPPTTQIIDHWPRFSSTWGAEGNLTSPTFDGIEYWADYDFNIVGSEAFVTATTYRYEIANSSGTLQEHPDGGRIRTAYSLHLFDPSTTNINDTDLSGHLNVSPNPGTGLFILEYELLNAVPYSIQLLDIGGKVLMNINPEAKGSGIVSLDLTSFGNGVYICQLITDKGMLTRRIIKQ